MPEILFEDLDATDRRIVQLAEDIGYVTLSEVVSRNSAALLGRVDFTTTALAPFLSDPADSFNFMHPQPDGVSNEQLAGAVSGWVRRFVRENMAGRRSCKFKLCIWGPKGDALLYSTRFVARRAQPSPESDDEEEDRPAGITPPSPTMPIVPTGILPPEAMAWQALSGGYVHFVSLLQNGYAHLFGLQNSAIGVLSSDNQRLRKTLEDAYGDLAKLRIGTFEAENGQRQEVASTKVREELGKQFIAELGALGRVVAGAKLGLPAELVELIELVNTTPELAEAIRDPEVRKVLRDEKTRKELAALLKLAAATPPTTEKPEN